MDHVSTAHVVLDFLNLSIVQYIVKPPIVVVGAARSSSKKQTDNLNDIKIPFESDEIRRHLLAMH